MSRSAVTTATSIALLSWASFSFNASAREQTSASSNDSPPRQVERDRLHSVRIGQEVVTKECEGEQVSLVQSLLNSRGATPLLNVTGVFDAATERAVRSFQSKHQGRSGLPLAKDGSVGMDTLYALEHPGPAAPRIKHEGVLADVLNQVRLYKQGDSGPAVIEIKRLLNVAGASPRLRETPHFDSATTRAVADFQARRNVVTDRAPLPIDGVVKRKTAEALQEAGKTSALTSAITAVQKTLNGKNQSTVPRADFKTFESALAMVLKLEGGLSKDPHDNGNKGGNVTMQGVTQPVYDRYRSMHEKPKRSVSLITPSEVKQLYYELYWIEGKCNQLPQNLAVAHFNTCVNMGPRAAAAILQISVGARVDRQIGPKTIRAAQEVDPHSATEIYLDEVEQRYHKIAVGNNQRYLEPWLRRHNVVRATCGATGLIMPPMMALSGPPPTTDYGISLSEGLRNFQAAHGLLQSGVLDDETEWALK